MLKVLNIFPTAKFGGAPINILRLISNNKNNKHVIITSAGDKNFFDKFVKNSSKCYDVNVLKVSLKSIIQVVRIVSIEKPDILHAHGKGGAFYVFIASLVLFKPAKVIYTFHGFNNRFNGLGAKGYFLFEKLFSFFVDKYITVSNSEREKVINANFCASSKINVIPNGVAIEKSELSLEKKNLLLKFDKNIVSLSRISPQKDLITMLHAFRNLLDKTTQHLALHIIGGYIELDNEYSEEVFKLHRQLELEDNVFFWGELPFSANYLHHFDLYLTTALWEGLPTAVLEAMMQKILIVATDCVGNIDLVFDKRNGFLTEMKNIENISNTISIALKSDNKSLIENAFSFVNENFSEKKYVSNIQNLYSGL